MKMRNLLISAIVLTVHKHDQLSHDCKNINIVNALCLLDAAKKMCDPSFAYQGRWVLVNIMESYNISRSNQTRKKWLLSQCKYKDLPVDRILMVFTKRVYKLGTIITMAVIYSVYLAQHQIKQTLNHIL